MMLYKKKGDDTTQNFWIAYADLMAGLLFVFILLIGTIVVKYVFMQSDLQAIKTDLDAQKRSLQISEEALAKKKEAVALMTDQLIASKQKNLELSVLQAQLRKKVESLEHNVSISDEALKAARALLAQEAEAIESANELLNLKHNEINALKSFLLQVENERDGIVTIKEALSRELESTKSVLMSTKTSLGETAYQLTIKEGELVALSKALMEKTLAHQQLVEDLDLTKARIKNLTGIRIKVIQSLKAKLGDAITIDPKSGAIRLPASILFEKRAFTLKPKAKEELKKTLVNYMEVLLGDPEIRKNIDSIIIEGHTDSDGSYMYNLELSQKRAFTVMEFIYSWDESDDSLLQHYLTASGRSFSDPILKDGIEDKEASRRIEIKFNIANKKAIQEIETFLESTRR